jgi:hypothetical protein
VAHGDEGGCGAGGGGVEGTEVVLQERTVEAASAARSLASDPSCRGVLPAAIPRTTHQAPRASGIVAHTHQRSDTSPASMRPMTTRRKIALPSPRRNASSVKIRPFSSGSRARATR